MRLDPAVWRARPLVGKINDALARLTSSLQ